MANPTQNGCSQHKHTPLFLILKRMWWESKIVINLKTTTITGTRTTSGGLEREKRVASVSYFVGKQWKQCQTQLWKQQRELHRTYKTFKPSSYPSCPSATLKSSPNCLLFNALSLFSCLPKPLQVSSHVLTQLFYCTYFFRLIFI